jgi:hypothetical protein
MAVFKVLTPTLMLVAILSCSGLAAAQNLRELAREQAIRNPGVPLEQPAAPGDYSPKTIEELSEEADVVLQAKLSRINSYLSSTEDRVLTDYSMAGGKVIAGRLPLPLTRVPGTAPPLILTVYGGEVTIEGVAIRGTDNSREPIRQGTEYLLFLMRSRRPELGRYEIYHAGIFEIVQDEVKPLLKRAGDVFKGTSDTRLKDLISRIQAAVRVR